VIRIDSSKNPIFSKNHKNNKIFFVKSLILKRFYLHLGIDKHIFLSYTD